MIKISSDSSGQLPRMTRIIKDRNRANRVANVGNYEKHGGLDVVKL